METSHQVLLHLDFWDTFFESSPLLGMRTEDDTHCLFISSPYVLLSKLLPLEQSAEITVHIAFLYRLALVELLLAARDSE